MVPWPAAPEPEHLLDADSWVHPRNLPNQKLRGIPVTCGPQETACITQSECRGHSSLFLSYRPSSRAEAAREINTAGHQASFLLVAKATLEAQDGRVKQQCGSSGRSTGVSPEKIREKVKSGLCKPTLGPGPLANSHRMGQGDRLKWPWIWRTLGSRARVATKLVSKQMAASVPRSWR